MFATFSFRTMTASAFDFGFLMRPATTGPSLLNAAHTGAAPISYAAGAPSSVEPELTAISRSSVADLPTIPAVAVAKAAAMDFTGHRGADLVQGTALNDRIAGRGGDDYLFGNKGSDSAFGGAGRDFIAGDRGGDHLNGGKGHDMLRGGRGDDHLNGGRGNDVIDAGRGHNIATGGAGADVFVFDAGSPGRTVVRDFSAHDLILFTGVATTASGTPEGYSAHATLADLPHVPGVASTAGGTPDGFTFRETDKGYLIITMENVKLVLRNTTADEVELDQIGFSSKSGTATLTTFGGSGTATVGTAISDNAMTISHAGDGTQLGYGGSGIMFETYMGDVQGALGGGGDLFV